MNNPRFVLLLDANICLSCRFGGIGTVTTSAGKVVRMAICKRLDCDNWSISERPDIPVKIEADADTEL